MWDKSCLLQFFFWYFDWHFGRLADYKCLLVILSFCHHFILSSCHLVILSTCHLVLLSSCHSVLLSSCHLVILSFCHLVSLSICELFGLHILEFVSFSSGILIGISIVSWIWSVQVKYGEREKCIPPPFQGIPKPFLGNMQGEKIESHHIFQERSAFVYSPSAPSATADDQKRWKQNTKLTFVTTDGCFVLFTS